MELAPDMIILPTRKWGSQRNVAPVLGSASLYFFFFWGGGALRYEGVIDHSTLASLIFHPDRHLLFYMM